MKYENQKIDQGKKPAAKDMNQYQTFHNSPQVLELLLCIFPCFLHSNNTNFLLRIQRGANGKSSI